MWKQQHTSWYKNVIGPQMTKGEKELAIWFHAFSRKSYYFMYSVHAMIETCISDTRIKNENVSKHEPN